MTAAVIRNSHFTSIVFNLCCNDTAFTYTRRPPVSLFPEIAIAIRHFCFNPFSFSSCFPKAEETISSANMSLVVLNLHRGMGRYQAACASKPVGRERVTTLLFKQENAKQCCTPHAGRRHTKCWASQQAQLLSYRQSGVVWGQPHPPWLWPEVQADGPVTMPVYKYTYMLM